MKPLVKVLSDEDISRIHQNSLTLLSKIGMFFPSKEVCDLLRQAGAEASGKDTIRIPESLIEIAIRSVPKRKSVILYGRESKHDIAFEPQEPKLACMTMATSVIDPDSGEKRPASNKDLARLTRLADSLAHVEVNGGLITPQDVPGGVNDWYTWATCLKNTTKHITGGVLGARGVRDAIEMAAIAVGDKALFLKRPSISGWVLTLPPLGIDEDSLEALMELGRWKIPAMVSSGPILGVTSPVTIAGTVGSGARRDSGVSRCVPGGQPWESLCLYELCPGHGHEDRKRLNGLSRICYLEGCHGTDGSLPRSPHPHAGHAPGCETTGCTGRV